VRYLALATDYDGTLATHGSVEPEDVDALERLRASGRKALLVTGRELDDLQRVFDRIDVFDRVVAENGALIYRPETRETELLASGPPAGFAEELRRRGVDRVSVGHVVVATWEPHEAIVLETIRDMGLELQVIFNKGAVMVLPSGINKATGLAEALRELGLSAHNVVGVGDAENDHAFLELCEASVAVANALDSLKERCDHVTKGTHGAGVRELIEGLLEDDLAWLRPARNRIPIGTADDKDVWVEPSGSHVLVAGPSGSGKSMLTTSFLERLSDAGYQFCLIDPEGDYGELEGAVKLGDQERAPSVAEVLELLENPDDSVVVNLLGVALEERPAFSDGLVPRLQELRSRRGRPHWIVIDEAHHLLPKERDVSDATVPRVLEGTWMITVHPDRVVREALEAVDVLFAVGRSPEETVRAVAEVTGTDVPDLPTAEEGRVVAWFRDAGDPFAFAVTPPRTELRRHKRKYMRGDLHEKAFRFRGPEGKLDLRAQNLAMFMQIGEGVDEETWLHHLRRGDYSWWFREAIKDEALAEAAERLEREESIPADEARRRLREAIEERYTLPA
jgi:hydroxymethylpyrimidine pyrophosphatase-like HAD family hydrolase/energy-coupling factor transporter ATP-binding protein EcfA2